MAIKKLTLRELREMAELAAQIKNDLFEIGDLGLLKERLSGIIVDLDSIQDRDINLDSLEDETANVISNLNEIEIHNMIDDVDDLAESTSQIANLNAIEAHNMIDDVEDLLESTNQIVTNLNAIESAK
jgi:hypothetical protein